MRKINIYHFFRLRSSFEHGMAITETFRSMNVSSVRVKVAKNVSISIDHDANNKSNVSYHRTIDRSKFKASNLEKLVRRNVETVET